MILTSSDLSVSKVFPVNLDLSWYKPCFHLGLYLKGGVSQCTYCIGPSSDLLPPHFLWSLSPPTFFPLKRWIFEGVLSPSLGFLERELFYLSSLCCTWTKALLPIIESLHVGPATKWCSAECPYLGGQPASWPAKASFRILFPAHPYPPPRQIVLLFFSTCSLLAGLGLGPPALAHD